jgi:hypothetical protein
MRKIDRVASVLSEWLIERDPDDVQQEERVVFRNGNYYFLSPESDENIWLGQYPSEPSASAWVDNKTQSHGYKYHIKTIIIPIPGSGGNEPSMVVESVEETDLTRTEYYEPWWEIGDSMGGWEPDPSLVFPWHWICQQCHIQMPKHLAQCDYCA